MLPSSVRRIVSSAASSAPQAGFVSSLASSAPKTAPIIVRGHQRRFSSSKPSRSDNGSSEIAVGQSVSAASARADGKAGSEKRKRKNKDAAEQAGYFKKMPSVPMTDYLTPETIGLSSFFSLHRPISVSQSMPQAVSDEHFASIFNSRTKSHKVVDTMSTLADTIDQLERPMAQITIAPQQEEQGSEPMHKVDMRKADRGESSIYLSIDTMSGEFLPFRPPPLPQPQANGLAEVDPMYETPQKRVYEALFTIEETLQTDGEIDIIAHSPRIIQEAQEEQPRSFLRRMAIRQTKFDEAQGTRRGMYAISVKRQRKLKMKKKKYKKLMRRTRVLRRKLERT
ncbi:hypothetical protein G7046_g5392 [Stylonectria norvegica]|nr:hypothetical protein G7046_g5392 [Stylonectria norvegica]